MALLWFFWSYLDIHDTTGHLVTNKCVDILRNQFLELVTIVSEGVFITESWNSQFLFVFIECELSLVSVPYNLQ